MGVDSCLYMYDVVVKRSRLLSHLLLSTYSNKRLKKFWETDFEN